MPFMNGGFRWTVLITLAAGMWLAGTVATLQMRDMSDRKIAEEAAHHAIAQHDSMVKVIADSLLSTQAQMLAGIEILRDRGYRYDDLPSPQKAKKKHAQEGSDRDERRR